MRFIKSRNNYKELSILENVQQAKSILIKNEIPRDNMDYLFLRDEIVRVFNNLNYLGLMTKFHFEQETSLDEIKDLLPWLKENGDRLSKEPLKYKKFEELKDEIIQIDNKQKVKTIYDLFPSTQKELIEKNEVFFNRAIEIHETGMLKEFGGKLSKLKSFPEILNYMKGFLEKNAEKTNIKQVSEQLRKNNSEIVYQDLDSGLIVGEIKDFEASEEMGSNSWCISTNRGNWNSYTGGTRRQFFIWDFSLEKANPLFLIGFTTNNKGKVTDIHDKRDTTLIGSIPDKIIRVIQGLDFSTSPLDYRKEILEDIEVTSAKRIPTEDRDIIFIDVQGDYGRFKQKGWDYFKSELHNYYVIFNFKHDLNDREFSTLITTQKFKNKVELNITIGDFKNKITIVDGKLPNTDKFLDAEKMVIDAYKNKLITPLNTEIVYSKYKTEYLDEVEKLVKNDNDDNIVLADNYGGITKYIPMGDETSTGNLWLFNVGYRSHLDNFKTKDMTENGMGVMDLSNRELQKYNFYVLIDIDKDYIDEDFVRFIKAEENNIVIKYHKKEETIKTYTNETLPNDIKELVDNNFLVPKSKDEYNKEISQKRREFWDKVEEDYSDSTVEERAKVLYEYLVDEGDIDGERVMSDGTEELIDNLNTQISELEERISNGENQFEDELENLKEQLDEAEDEDNDEYWEDGFSEDSEEYKKVLIPTHEHYDMPNYEIYNYNMITGNSYQMTAYCVGTDDEADRAAKDYLKQLIDEMGPSIISDYMSYVDKEGLTDYLMNGERDNYEETVRDDPENYNVSKNMSDGTEDLIDSLNSQISELESLIEDYDEDNSNEHTYDELEEKLDEVREKLDEVEDEDNDEYWEYDEGEIDDAIDNAYENKKSDVAQDPIAYLTDELGYEGTGLKDMISSYIETDEMIDDAIRIDGRGHNLSGYDGHEIEYTYDGETYYIYRTN